MKPRHHKNNRWFILSYYETETKHTGQRWNGRRMVSRYSESVVGTIRQVARWGSDPAAIGKTFLRFRNTNITLVSVR